MGWGGCDRSPEVFPDPPLIATVMVSARHDGGTQPRLVHQSLRMGLPVPCGRQGWCQLQSQQRALRSRRTGTVRGVGVPIRQRGGIFRRRQCGSHDADVRLRRWVRCASVCGHAGCGHVLVFAGISALSKPRELGRTPRALMPGTYQRVVWLNIPSTETLECPLLT